MEPFDVMDVGRMAIIQDPTGANIMVWEPKRHIGAEIIDARLNHNTIDWDCYTSLLAEADALICFRMHIRCSARHASPRGPAATTWTICVAPGSGHFTMNLSNPCVSPRLV